MLKTPADKTIQEQGRTLRVRLVLLLTLVLTPLLVVAGMQALFQLRSAHEDRLDDLVLLSDAISSSIENELSAVEALTAAFSGQLENSACTEVLDRIQRVVPHVQSTISVNGEGVMECTTAGPANRPSSFPERLTMMEEGPRTRRTRVFYGPRNGAWLISVLRRVEIGDERYDGYVGVSIHVQRMVDTLFGETDQGIDVALADSMGRVYGSNRFEVIPLEWFDGLSRSERARALTDVSPSDGKLDIVVRAVGTDDLYAVVSKESPGFFSAAGTLPITLFFYPVMMFLFALAGAIWAIDRLVVRWLPPLRKLALAYGEGLYDFRNQNFSAAPGEINELADAMTHMAGRISERDSALRSAIEMRDAAVREIHHRIKNNLQVVTSFVSLQARSVSDPVAIQVLGEVRHRIDALSIVHQTLYAHERLDRVDLKPFHDALLTHLRDALNMEDAEIECSWSTANIDRSADLAIPLALFLVEVITDIVYRFFGLEGGTLRIELVEDEGLVLRITAEGGDTLTEDPANGHALSEKLISAFAKQLGGELETVFEPGVRASYELKVVDRF